MKSTHSRPISSPLRFPSTVLTYLDHQPNYPWLVLVPKVPGLIESDKGESGKGERKARGRAVIKDPGARAECPPKGCQPQSSHWLRDKRSKEGTTRCPRFFLNSHTEHPCGVPAKNVVAVFLGNGLYHGQVGLPLGRAQHLPSRGAKSFMYLNFPNYFLSGEPRARSFFFFLSFF